VYHVKVRFYILLRFVRHMLSTTLFIIEAAML